MSLVRQQNAWDIDKYFRGPNLFDEFFKAVAPEIRLVQGHDNQFSPQVSEAETDTQLVVALATPGLVKEDLKVEVENNILSVSYEKKEEDNNSFVKKSFSRRWSLPKGSTTELIEAEFKNGVLTVTVDKPTPPEPKTHTVKIK